MFSKLKVLLLYIFLEIFLNNTAAQHTTETPYHNVSYDNSTCFVKVILLQYDINIGAVQNSSREHDRVSCSVKIKAKIERDDCGSANNLISGTFLRLNTRNCKLDLDGITISKVKFEEQARLLNIKNYYIENLTKSDDFTKYIFELEESEISVGDHILLHVPYSIELKKDYPKETYEGLYYFDPSDNNDTDFLFYFPLHARHIFPVFDNFDPFHKPTFKISLARFNSSKFVSISNTDIVKTVESPELGDGLVTDYFRESPTMKIDQVTLFLLGGFENHTIIKENLNNNNSELTSSATNLWTMKQGDYKNEMINHTLFEIEKFMNYFKEMFNKTKYPLNKINFIAVPWNTGSMSWQKSNLGIVISGDYGILKYSKGYLDESKGNIDLYEFITSQIALQWFRGITSNDKYSNEALSGEALAYYVINWVLKYRNEPIPPFLTDNHETELPSLFSMMENILSREILEYAICEIYLPTSIHIGTFPDNLWNSIEQSLQYHNKTDLLPSNEKNATVEVSEIFNSWINNLNQQPVIRINQVENISDSIELYQENKEAVDSRTNWWWIPVNISTENGHMVIWISPNHTSTNSSKIYQN